MGLLLLPLMASDAESVEYLVVQLIPTGQNLAGRAAVPFKFFDDYTQEQLFDLVRDRFDLPDSAALSFFDDGVLVRPADVLRAFCACLRDASMNKKLWKDYDEVQEVARVHVESGKPPVRGFGGGPDRTPIATSGSATAPSTSMKLTVRYHPASNASARPNRCPLRRIAQRPVEFKRPI